MLCCKTRFNAILGICFRFIYFKAALADCIEGKALSEAKNQLK